MPLKYKRVLLKLSGEALAGDKKIGLDYDVVFRICQIGPAPIIWGCLPR